MLGMMLALTTDCRKSENVHLRIEDGDRRLNNRNTLLEDLEGVEVLTLRDHGLQLQSHILRMHDSCKRVCERLPRLCRDGGTKLGASQVAHRLRWVRSAWHVHGSQDSSQCHQHTDVLILVVHEVEHSTRGPAIDQLDSKDLSIGEVDVDVDLQLASCLAVVASGVRQFLYVLEGRIFGNGGVFDLKKNGGMSYRSTPDPFNFSELTLTPS